eukprot:UN1448
MLSRLLSDEKVKAMTDQAAEMHEKMGRAAHMADMARGAEKARKFTSSFHKTVSNAWSLFSSRSKNFHNPDPQALLHEAKLALLETGALQEMRKLARVTANASRAMSQGAVPLDSMSVGLGTSVAPWNNILKLFSVPLIKAQFNMFANFFGPDGNAARACVEAQVAVDSSYRVHLRREFSGINLWVGPAKWDNVPGWAFGTSGGFDNMRILDVADFGWEWTLAREPETVGFFYEVGVIDDEALHAGMLQTGSEVQTEQVASKVAEIPRHGSSWVSHTWCSPDWENTPLVIPEDEPVGTMMKEESSADSSSTYFKNAEDWDPESEAV